MDRIVVTGQSSHSGKHARYARAPAAAGHPPTAYPRQPAQRRGAVRARSRLRRIRGPRGRRRRARSAGHGGIRLGHGCRPRIDPADVAQVARARRRPPAPPRRRLALLSRAEKDAALRTIADALEAATDDVVAANERGPRPRPRARHAREPARTACASTPPRVAAVAQALRDIAALPDPVGEVVRGSTLANGLADPPGPRPDGRRRHDLRGPPQRHRRRRRPRPEVAATPSSCAAGQRRRRHQPRHSSPCCAASLEAPGPARRRRRPRSTGGHGAVRALMTARGLVDLLIPRGGADLIQTVVTESTVPVIETGVGNCHVYVDRGRRPRQGARDHGQLQDPPAQRVQRRRVAARAPRRRRGVPAQGPRRARRARASPLHADAGCRRAGRQRPASPTTRPPTRTSPPSTSASRSRCGVVDDLDEALEHIRRYGSGHTEAIVTEDRAAARRFTAEVDAAAVMVNASAPASPTAASSASAPRSASRPRSCTPAARWPCPS